MQRMMYLSRLKQQHSETFLQHIHANQPQWEAYLANQRILEAVLFQDDDLLMLYVESEGEPLFEWPEPYMNWLEQWPTAIGLASCMPLMDIFHDGLPASQTTWREREPEQRFGAIARLKPEMYASYVFYHYQLQEEKPSHFNKMYMIGACGNLIFSYSESPATMEQPPRQGLLQTSNTPSDWVSAMDPHFIPWEGEPDKSRLWRQMRLVHCYSDSAFADDSKSV
ncbi:hypothetical protein EBB07_01930 [Paenibacillaceae bacterium]|nr:hypothetical protein EBB07_01930 [Paenibacillaceae bacterium]